MKIRTQFIITLLSFALLLIGMAASLFFTNQQVDQLRGQEEIARRIEEGADELNYLSGDYLMYGESQQRARWEARFITFSEDLAKLKPANLEQQAMISHMIADAKRLQALFRDVVATLERSAQNSGNAPDPAFNQISWSRMEVQNQSIAFEASRLSQQLREQADQLRQLNSVLIFILIGIFGAYLIVNFSLIDRRTLRSIAELQSGTQIIGSGNLDFTIPVQRADEVGELSHAFNVMTASLKEVTASKVDLEREIAERERAERSLRKANERLQEQAEELDVQAAELRLQADELAAANEKLRDVNNRLQAQAVELEMQAQELQVQKDELVVTNKQLRLSEELSNQRSMEIQAANQELQSARLAALNLMEDALHAQEQVEQINFSLRESEQRLNRAQEIAHLGSWELDLIKNQLTWSDEVYRIFGLQPQEFGATYESFLEVVHPDDRAAVDAAYAGSIREGRDQYEIEHRVVRRSSGEIRFVHEKCEHFRNDAGQIIRSVGMVHDITERKRAEEALRRFELLSEHSRDIILFMRLEDGCILEANHAAMQAYGYSRDELLALSVRDLHAPNTQNLTREQMAEANEKGLLFEAIHQRKDGTTFPVEVSSQGATIGGVRTFISIIRDITERKQAEEALRLSEEKFRSAFANAAIGFAMTMPDGRFVDANPAYCVLTGYEIKELQAMEFSSLIHPEDSAENMKLISQMLAGQISDFVLENRYLRKTKEPVWVRKSVSLVRNVENAPQWIIALVEDITERKLAEEALRESEAKYRNLFENMTEEVHFWQLVYDEDGRIQTWRLVDANPPTLKSWNRKTADEIKGKTTDEIFGPGATEHFMPVVQKIMTEGVPYSFEDYFSHLDKYFRFTSVPLGDHFITTGADITIIKKAEAALRAARDELELRVQERTEELATANKSLLKEIAERKEIERQLRVQTTAMEAAANGIIITDHEGNVQWANPALTQISGYEAHDLIGQSTRIFRSGQHDAVYYHQMWDTILAGQVWQGETINRRKDGNLYIEEQTITPVHDESGQIPHFIAIKQDITKRKQDEQELECRNQELQIISNAERNQRQFSEALVAAALNLNKSLKLSDVLSLILEQIRGVIPYQLADIALLEGESFYDASHQGDFAWPESLMGTNNRFFLESFPLLNKVSQSGEPVLVLDTQKEPDWILLEGLAWTRSFLSAPLLVEKKVIGFVNLFSDQPEFFLPEMSSRLAAFAAHAAVAIQNAWLFEQVQASTERLQSLSRRLVEIQENERRYISRELHDEAGQVLTSLLVDLRLLEKNISNPGNLQKIVTEMESSLSGVIENLHRIAMALRPASLDHVGLVAALRQHTESIAEKNGLRVSFTASGVVARLPANIETVIYRIVQEALTNIVRHAHASRVDVVLTVRDGKLIVIIEDDGVGFDADVTQPDKHLGLFGMRERIEMIDGKLIIESSPGTGTTIMMEVGYADTISSRG